MKLPIISLNIKMPLYENGKRFSVLKICFKYQHYQHRDVDTVYLATTFVSLTVTRPYFLVCACTPETINPITQYDLVCFPLFQGVFRLDLSQTTLTCRQGAFYREEKEAPPKVVHALYSVELSTACNSSLTN